MISLHPGAIWSFTFSPIQFSAKNKKNPQHFTINSHPNTSQIRSGVNWALVCHFGGSLQFLLHSLLQHFWEGAQQSPKSCWFCCCRAEHLLLFCVWLESVSKLHEFHKPRMFQLCQGYLLSSSQRARKKGKSSSGFWGLQICSEASKECGNSIEYAFSPAWDSLGKECTSRACHFWAGSSLNSRVCLGD